MGDYRSVELFANPLERGPAVKDVIILPELGIQGSRSPPRGIAELTL